MSRIALCFGTGSLIFLFCLSKYLVSEAKLADWLIVKNVAFNVNEVLKIISR